MFYDRRWVCSDGSSSLRYRWSGVVQRSRRRTDELAFSPCLCQRHRLRWSCHPQVCVCVCFLPFLTAPSWLSSSLSTFPPHLVVSWSPWWKHRDRQWWVGHVGLLLGNTSWEWLSQPCLWCLKKRNEPISLFVDSSVWVMVCMNNVLRDTDRLLFSIKTEGKRKWPLLWYPSQEPERGIGLTMLPPRVEWLYNQTEGPTLIIKDVSCFSFKLLFLCFSVWQRVWASWLMECVAWMISHKVTCTMCGPGTTTLAGATRASPVDLWKSCLSLTAHETSPPWK